MHIANCMPEFAEVETTQQVGNMTQLSGFGPTLPSLRNSFTQRGIAIATMDSTSSGSESEDLGPNRTEPPTWILGTLGRWGTLLHAITSDSHTCAHAPYKWHQCCNLIMHAVITYILVHLWVHGFVLNV